VPVLQAAYLACGHHVPVSRVAVLMCQLTGIAVSTGWAAGIRGKAAGLIEASGWADQVRDLLRQAQALHVDETPARAAGVLPGYSGIIVRDGYHGYTHLTDALHAWCAAHLLCDLQGLHDAEPGAQEWAARMACLLLHARDTAAAAQAGGQDTLDPAALDDLVTRYRAVAADGLWQNLTRHTATARDARAIARRFQRYEEPDRIRHRPVLPVHRQMGDQQTRRPPRPVQRHPPDSSQPDNPARAAGHITSRQ
jgi:transposase